MKLPRQARAARSLATCWALVAQLAVAACDPNPATSNEQQVEPSNVVNADLVPAPVDPEALAGSTPNGSGLKPMRETRTERAPLPFDLQRAPEAEAAEAEATHVGPLLSLEAHWAFVGQSAPNFAGLDSTQLEAARSKTTTQHVIDLLPSGRMRLTLLGGAFSLSAGTQLLARADRTGWVLLWPGLDQYRTLAAGSLLSVLREARADVVPLIAARIESERPLKERRFGFPLVRSLLTTNRGSVTLDQVEVPDAGSAGVGVCRMLIELLAAAPSAAVCDGRGVPVRAHFEYAGATLDWVADSLKQRTEGFVAIEVPPRDVSFIARGLPTTSRAFLSEAEAGSLRKSERRGRLRVANHDKVGAFLTLDGAPIAFVAPRHRLQVELPQGDFRLGVRDFLGVELQPAKPLKLEASAQVAWRTPDDAGAPR